MNSSQPMIAAAMALCIAMPVATADDNSKPRIRGLLGEDNPKIRKTGDRTLIWAGGGDPKSPDAQWYDFTGSPIDPSQLQFGIGKDRIKAIDNPVYVKPDDPRLLKIPGSRYRKNERPARLDDIMVTGVVINDVARAYPVALLDFHELVNDNVGGKPVTVGW